MYIFIGLLLLALCPIYEAQGGCANPSGVGSWASTYGSSLSKDVVISVPLLVDVSSITAQGITLSQGGMLYFDRTKAISLSATFILISSGGGMYIGSEDCPYTQKATITLTGNAVVSTMFGTNFIGVSSGGILELHGAKGLGSAWTSLSSTAPVGATSIQLTNSLNGAVAGDKVVIATSDYSPLQNEVVTITSINGNTIAFTPALQWSHYGAFTMNVDQRAEVGLLTRNILIQGAKQGNYLGGHTMVTRGFSQVHIEGVEFNNMGQDQIARYPVHFHLCGDVPTGTYVKYNSIHDTNFRCVTVHATNGLLVEGNVAYNNFGHCYFMEDGIEVNNIIRGNLAILTKPKDFGQRIGSDLPNTGLSSFWITNPQNTIEDNAAVASYTAGYWLITRIGARGASACIPIFQNLPYRVSDLPLTSFKNNSAHSCSFGLGVEATNWDSGDYPAQTCDTSVANWEPKVNGSLSWTTFYSFTAHHIRDRGVWARLPNIIVDGGRFADNYESIEYATSGDHPPYASQQIVQNSIIVGFSDNKGNQMADTLWQNWDRVLQHTVPSDVGSPMNGIKMYDGPQVILNTVFQNFISVAGRPLDSPVGARVADQAQVATTNYFKNVQFINCAYRYQVIDDVMDGGLTANFRDTDGSVTGYTGATALRDLAYYKTPQCQPSSSFMLACPHKYVQLWVLDMTSNGFNNNMYITRGHIDADHSSYTLAFKGFIAGPLFRYQPIVSLNNNYLVRFQAHVPSSLALQINNAENGDSVQVAVCYPLGTVISSVQRGYANWEGNAWPMNLPPTQLTNIASAGSPGTSGDSFYFNSAKGMLVLRVQQRNNRVDYGSFCPPQGCDFVWVNVQFNGPLGATARDCTQDAYNAGLLTPPPSWLAPKLLSSSFVPNTLQSIIGNVAGTIISGISNPTTSTNAPPMAAATTRPTSSSTTPFSSSSSSSSSSSTPTTTATPTTTSSSTDTPCTAQCGGDSKCCGKACYSPSQYQCNPGGKLCPLGNLSCGDMCYLPSQFTCVNNSALQALS